MTAGICNVMRWKWSFFETQVSRMKEYQMSGGLNENKVKEYVRILPKCGLVHFEK